MGSVTKLIQSFFIQTKRIPVKLGPGANRANVCVCVYHRDRDREIENMCTCECVSACVRVCACAGVLQYDKCVPPHNLCVSKYDVCEYEL